VSRSGWALGSALTFVGFLLLAEPFYRFSPAGRSFHLASAFESIALLAALWWAVRTAARSASGPPAVAAAPEVEHPLADRP
jgi:hypothetical protein